MNDATFDDIVRSLGRGLNRRRFLGGAAATTSLLLLGGKARAQSSADSAAQLVEQFYQFIDAYQYDEAYALLGSDLQAVQSQKDFETGYAGTAFVQMISRGVTSGANKTQDVAVELTSWHNDGSIQTFSGSYSVGNEGSQQRIVAASISETTAPDNLPPLCEIRELSFALGPWDAGAGSRSSSVIATNTRDETCALGGSPRLILTTSNGDQLVSTSETGSPPVAVTLEPQATAQAPMRFSNWCGSTSLSGVTLGIDVAGDNDRGSVDFAENSISFPPCNGAGQPATLGVKPWSASGA